MLKDGAPLEGIPIEFVVTGANPRTEIVLTDASGEAVLSYVGTNPGADTVTARTAPPVRRSGSSTLPSFPDGTVEVDQPPGVLKNDVLIAVVDVLGGSGVVCTPAEAWTLVRRINNGTDLAKIVYRRLAGSSEPAFYTFGFDSNRVAAITISAYGGADPDDYLDAEAGATTASGTNHAHPEISTTAANATLVANYAITSLNLVNSWTPPDGMNEIGDGGTARIIPGTTPPGTQNMFIGLADEFRPPGPSGIKTAVSTATGAGCVHLLALSALPELEAVAAVEWGLLGGGGGLRKVQSAEPVHMVLSERGVARWPVVSGFEALDAYNGGWKGAKGKISRSEFDAYPNVYSAGAEWFVFDRQYGTLLYRSELSEPVPSAGSVDLAGRGPGAVLDGAAPRLLFSAHGGSEWADGGAEPFEYGATKKIALSTGPNGVVWKIDEGRVFAGGEESRAVFYAEGFDGLSALAYRLRKDAHHGNLELVLRGRNVGEAGDYQAAATTIATWSLGVAGLADGADVDQQIAGGDYDLFELSLRTTGPFTAGDDIEVAARRLKVGGISEDYETTADDVFAEAFARIGCDVIRIEPNGTPVHPVDHRDGTYAGLLDSIALRIDYLYRVYWEGGKLVGEAGSWGSRRYTVLDPEIPRDIIPLQRFDRVTVLFTYPNGAPGRVRIRSEGLRLPVPKDAPPIRITGKPMDDEGAELVGATLADRLVTRRWSGSGQALEVVDDVGARVHANIIRAGDLLYYAAEAAEVRIGEVSLGAGPPSFRFTEGLPFLDRLSARLGIS